MIVTTRQLCLETGRGREVNWEVKLEGQTSVYIYIQVTSLRVELKTVILYHKHLIRDMKCHGEMLKDSLYTGQNSPVQFYNVTRTQHPTTLTISVLWATDKASLHCCDQNKSTFSLVPFCRKYAVPPLVLCLFFLALCFQSAFFLSLNKAQQEKRKNLH